jgi:hypothetical protein
MTCLYPRLNRTSCHVFLHDLFVSQVGSNLLLRVLGRTEHNFRQSCSYFQHFKYTCSPTAKKSRFMAGQGTSDRHVPKDFSRLLVQLSPCASPGDASAGHAVCSRGGGGSLSTLNLTATILRAHECTRVAFLNGVYCGLQLQP